MCIRDSFNTDIVTISANVTAAIVAVQTPITVIFGAILFNKFSEVSGATDTMRKWLGNINPNPVAQLMIIGLSLIHILFTKKKTITFQCSEIFSNCHFRGVK